MSLGEEIKYRAILGDLDSVLSTINLSQEDRDKLTAAVNAATAAAASQVAADAAKTAALAASMQAQGASASVTAALLEVNKMYLGSKTADPTVDNNGDPLVIGAMYYNSTTDKFRVYQDGGFQEYDAAAAQQIANAQQAAVAAAQYAAAASASVTQAQSILAQIAADAVSDTKLFTINLTGEDIDYGAMIDATYGAGGFWHATGTIPGYMGGLTVTGINSKLTGADNNATWQVAQLRKYHVNGQSDGNTLFAMMGVIDTNDEDYTVSATRLVIQPQGIVVPITSFTATVEVAGGDPNVQLLDGAHTIEVYGDLKEVVVHEAPADGDVYGRQNRTWVPINTPPATGGSAGGIYFGDTLPAINDHPDGSVFLRSDGIVFKSESGTWTNHGGLDTAYKYAANPGTLTAENGGHYDIDARIGVLPVTLPANPQPGWSCVLRDTFGAFAAHPPSITSDKLINSLSGALALNTVGEYKFVYTVDDGVGWAIFHAGLGGGGGSGDASADAAAAAQSASDASQAAQLAQAAVTAAQAARDAAAASRAAADASNTAVANNVQLAQAATDAAQAALAGAQTAQQAAAAAQSAAMGALGTVQGIQDTVNAAKAAAVAAANAASTSQTTVQGLLTSAQTSAGLASDAATAAQTSQTAAKKSADDAAASAASISGAAQTASDLVSQAQAARDAAAASATTATTQATASSNSAAAALASQNASKTSETNSKTSETNSKTSETNSAASATTASTQATNAQTSASQASASATSAGTSASTATTQATNASNSASTASTAATAAQSARDAAQAAQAASEAARDLAKQYRDAAQTAAGSAGGNAPGVNRVLNGDMRVQFRAASVNAVLGTWVYGGADHWCATASGAAASFTQNRVSAQDGNGVGKFWLCQTATAAVTDFSTTKYWSGFTSVIEGYNAYDLKGNPKGQSLSFWFKATVAGVYSYTLLDGAGNNFYIGAFNVSTANTPQKIAVQIPTMPVGASVAGDSTLATALILRVGGLNFGTYQAASNQNNTWQTSPYVCASGAVNWAATANNAIYITDVQLEEGQSATAFDKRILGHEMQMLSRYWQQFGNWQWWGYSASNGAALGQSMTFPPMRTTPTFSYTSVSYGSAGGLSTGQLSSNAVALYVTGTIAGQIAVTVTAPTFSAEFL